MLDYYLQLVSYFIVSAFIKQQTNSKEYNRAYSNENKLFVRVKIFQYK